MDPLDQQPVTPADPPAATVPEAHGEASAVLMEALPDLVLLIRRDGVVLGYSAGRSVTAIAPRGDCIGLSVDVIWSESLARLLKQLVRKAIAMRATAEAGFREQGQRYEVRVSAQGPERAICVIRPLLAAASEDTLGTTGTRRPQQLDRHRFLKRLRESLSMASLRDQPLALAVIHLDGLLDIARVIAASVSEQILTSAIMRLPVCQPDDEPRWYLGQLGDSMLAVVIESAEQATVEACTARLCDSLREPVSVGNGEFHLTPYAGVAIQGRDAASPKLLLDHARAAAAQARHAGSSAIRFFTDTLALKALARLDIAREMQQAIRQRDIRLCYVPRHDLKSGRRVAWVGYLRWFHPLRGEIRPVEFLRVAETTGLAARLSRAVLEDLPRDFAALCSEDPETRISFGALRHHLLHEDFFVELDRFLAAGAIPPERLELRISENVCLARDAADFLPLADRGVSLMVDELARGMGLLDWLARAPLWGLQLDRAWVTALRQDPVALKVCRAGISMASALGLMAVAAGVDDAAQREALLALGCRYGTGDLYGAVRDPQSERNAEDVRRERS